jgi:hypothetical protein
MRTYSYQADITPLDAPPYQARGTFATAVSPLSGEFIFEIGASVSTAEQLRPSTSFVITLLTPIGQD